MAAIVYPEAVVCLFAHREGVSRRRFLGNVRKRRYKAGVIRTYLRYEEPGRRVRGTSIGLAHEVKFGDSRG